MEVILLESFDRLGQIGDVVKVKNGFARNYLFPNKMALRNNKENRDHYEKIKEDVFSKENEKKEKAILVLEKIKKTNISFIKEADEKDQLNGSVSKKEILNFLENSGISILSDEIKIIEPIRTLGEHFIEILCHLYGY